MGACGGLGPFLVAAFGACERGRQTGDLPAKKGRRKTENLRDGGAGAEAAGEATSKCGVCFSSRAPSRERGRKVGFLGFMAPGEG